MPIPKHFIHGQFFIKMSEHNQTQVHAITKVNQGLSRSIVTPVEITNVFTNEKIQTKGIWDTGATGSTVTQSIAAVLGLLPVRRAMVRGVHGNKEVNVYYVNITLDNKNITLNTRVTECDELSSDNSVGMLIGMNIITMGYFVITNYHGDTIMSFRIPSMQKIDFLLPA